VVIFFTILPAIMIVAGGPAILQIYRQLLPVLGGQQGG
jgi:hypothetical protein